MAAANPMMLALRAACGTQDKTRMLQAVQNLPWCDSAPTEINEPIPNTQGMTPLLLAAALGALEAVKALLVGGAEHDVTDEFGWTAVMHAAKGGHEEVCYELLNSMANANIKSTKRTPSGDEAGWTALIIALVHKHANVAALLVDNDADVTVVASVHGKTTTVDGLARALDRRTEYRADLLEALEAESRRSGRAKPVATKGLKAPGPQVLRPTRNDGIANTLRGSTAFNSLEEKNLTKLALTDNAPKGRYVAPGLNAEGVCLNVKGCEAARVKRSVIIPRGFGVVRPIEEELGPDMCCPVCRSTKVKLHTMGFYQCDWEWWGRIITTDATQDGRVSGSGRADDGQYHVFEGTKVQAPTPAEARVVGDTNQYTALVFKARKLPK